MTIGLALSRTEPPEAAAAAGFVEFVVDVAEELPQPICVLFCIEKIIRIKSEKAQSEKSQFL